MATLYEKNLMKVIRLKLKYVTKSKTVKEGDTKSTMIFAKLKRGAPPKVRSLMFANSAHIATIVPSTKKVFFFPSVLKHTVKRRK